MIVVFYRKNFFMLTPTPSVAPIITKPVVQKWAVSSRIFHWVSVVLLIVTWTMIYLNKDATDFTYLNLHKAFGISVLCWTVARIINRFLTKAPPDVPMPKSQTIIAHLTHLLLYGLLIAMPMAGWLMSMYGNHPVSFFGLFNIPVLVTPNKSTAGFFNNLHTHIIWPMLWIFSGLHIAAALFHQFVKKDNLIVRMR